MAKKLLTSPRGIFGWVTLNEPDTKYKSEGEYKVTLLLPAKSAEAKALRKQIDEAFDEAQVQAKKENPGKKIKPCEDRPYRTEVTTDEDGNETATGNTAFNFKMKASGTSRRTGKDFEQRPAMFDRFGKPVDPSVVKVGRGTEGRVSYTIAPFWTAKLGAGVTLYLHGVQIITLVEFSGSQSAEAHGFEEEDGDFDGTTAAAKSAPASDDTDEDEDTADDTDEDTDEEEEEEEAPKPAKKPSKGKKPAPVEESEDEDEDEF